MTTSRQAAALQNVVRTLREGDKSAQIAAIHALGRSEERAATTALVSALKSADPDIRTLAMGKLAFSGAKAIVPAVVKRLDDPEPRVRQNAIYALRRLGAKPAADKVALLLNADPNEVVRLNAAWALGVLGAKKHAPALVRALDDANVNVVFASLRSLAAVAPKEVHVHVIKLARDPRRWGRTPDTQRDVILRLLHGDLDKKPVADLLRDVVRDGIRQAKREGKRPTSLGLREASSLLSEIGDRTGVPVLLDSLKGGEYPPQMACIALARLRETAAVPLILEGPMKNAFYPVMLKAVRALGEIGDARALPALASFFNDRVDDFPIDRSLLFCKDDPDLRLNALVAMGKIAARNLVEAVNSSDAFQRKLASELLAANW
jgi:HEAT repeat protein